MKSNNANTIPQRPNSQNWVNQDLNIAYLAAIGVEWVVDFKVYSRECLHFAWVNETIKSAIEIN